MEGRGYILDAENPDLIVNFNIVVEEIKVFGSVSNSIEDNGYVGHVIGREKPYKYKEGLLIIELIDKNANQLVWQGYSSGIIKEKTEVMEEKIRASVSLIFSQFKFRSS